jgi:geranylgeranylglycerol-phosphate geranylgeranyltransferase
MRRFKHILGLIRLHNTILAAIGVWMGYYLSPGSDDDPDVYFAALAAALICGAGNSLNDYLDVDVDRLNHPSRPLPSGAVPPYLAVEIFLLFNVAAVVIGMTLSLPVFLVIVGAILLLVLYNFRLKKFPLLGNVAVSFLGGATFLVGAMVESAKNILHLPGALVPAVFAFLFHLSRELIKDAADYDGDDSADYKTLPMIVSSMWMQIIILIMIVVLVLLTLVPVAEGWYRPAFDYMVIFLVDVPLLGIAAYLFISNRQKRFAVASNVMKILMLVGLAAFFAGGKINF